MMYLINFEALLQQLLPVVWRSSWRVTLFRALMQPLIHVYTQLHNYQQSVELFAYRTPQVMVLESILTEHAQSRVFVATSEATSFEFLITYPNNLTGAQVDQLRGIANKHKLSGTTFRMVSYLVQ